MSTFNETFEALDAAVIAAVGDDVEINGVPVRGIFEAPWIGPKIGNTRTGLNEPNFTARTVDLASVAVNHVLTYVDANYVVVRPEPSGDGMTTLVLRRQ